MADFSSNPIPRLPPAFSQLKSLTILGLNDMSLTSLPSDFGMLTSLTSLELRENLLKELPPSLAHLTNLERLDLGDNEIEELVIHGCNLEIDPNTSILYVLFLKKLGVYVLTNLTNWWRGDMVARPTNQRVSLINPTA